MTEPQGEYVCTLPPELVEKAEKELNEKPQWRSRDIQALRDMVLKQRDLKVRTDDAFLLRFLRAKKFDYDRAFQLIMTHYKMKVENKEIFTNLRPSAVKHVLDDGVTGVLASRDKEGRPVIVLRPGKWDVSRYGLDDIFRTNFMTLSKLIEDEETQVNGLIMVIDLKEMGWNHAKNVSPFYAKRVASLLQDAFPARFKGLHYLHQPSFFDYVFSIVKQFLKEKTVSRLHFHGEKPEGLTEYIDKANLPKEYGGELPPFSNKDWAETLLKCDEQFDQEAKYGLLDSTTKATKSSKADAMECLVGSYRKLDV
ncbi:alpha-tocopherol transfer protein-like [Ylistrum balloti]|uniref:alpha-tocopherol transfer protein-like n=1 Tax=Ylistrum balloti TaxID=509963 RepID=UPI002905B722|nr:alpha-tocopherol transfer protein-like [Ylistrum balloti]